MAPRTPVAACYLELAEPSIAQGIEQLIARGVRQVVVLPLLLFAAGHAKEDVPTAVHACQGNYPGVEFTFASHLGCHERLLQLSAQRFGEACQKSADHV